MADKEIKSVEEVLDTPEKVKRFFEWVFDDEVDKKLLNGEEVSIFDYVNDEGEKK